MHLDTGREVPDRAPARRGAAAKLGLALARRTQLRLELRVLGRLDDQALLRPRADDRERRIDQHPAGLDPRLRDIQHHDLAATTEDLLHRTPLFPMVVMITRCRARPDPAARPGTGPSPRSGSAGCSVDPRG